MIEAVTATNLPEFREYCRLWAASHDESFVPSQTEALEPDQPSFVLRQGGRVVGAASLMVGGSWARAGQGRFAVLHAGGGHHGSAQDYGELIEACRRAAGSRVRTLSLFLPESLTTPRDHLTALGFGPERLVSLMARSTTDTPRAEAPGYRLRSLARHDPALSDFLAVRNRNFREVVGSNDQTLEDMDARFTDAEAWPGGINLLVDTQGRPCGTFALEQDDEPDALFLATIAVDRHLRSQGLGRFLVRSALDLARNAGKARVYLSVNALNAQARRLYESEGFQLVKAMVCLVLPI